MKKFDTKRFGIRWREFFKENKARENYNQFQRMFM